MDSRVPKNVTCGIFRKRSLSTKIQCMTCTSIKYCFVINVLDKRLNTTVSSRHYRNPVLYNYWCPNHPCPTLPKSGGGKKCDMWCVCVCVYIFWWCHTGWAAVHAHMHACRPACQHTYIHVHTQTRMNAFIYKVDFFISKFTGSIILILLHYIFSHGNGHTLFYIEIQSSLKSIKTIR